MAKKAKRKYIFSTLIALLGATSFLASCSAPGSSKPIPKGGEDTKIPGITWGEKHKGYDAPSDEPVFKNENNANSVPDPVISFENENIEKEKSNLFIAKNQKIRYVALGDSIAAGFDGSLPKDYQGELVNGEITGVSYSSFLARLLNQNSRVEFYKNYSFSGATAIDWINLLGMDYEDHLANNARVIGKFGENGLEKINEMKKQLRNANLVTLSIGANDLFYLIFKAASKSNLKEVFANLTSENPSYGSVLEFVNSVFKASLPEAKKRLSTLVANLKALAPKANINIIGYPMPFLGLKQMVDDLVTDLLGGMIEFSPLDFFLEFLNSGLKNIARNSGVNYIDSYNQEYWNPRSLDFSNIYFDIHTNTRGYKKMAMDIYLKITNPSFKIADYESGDFGFTQAFLSDDAQYARYQIEPSDTPTNIIGTSSQAYLDNESKYERYVDSFRDNHNYGDRIARLSNLFRQLSQEVINFITSSNYYRELDPNGLFKNILKKQYPNEISGVEHFVQAIKESGFLKNTLFNFQSGLEKFIREDGKIQVSKLPALLISSAINEENIIGLVAAIAGSPLVSENKTDVIQAINEIFQNGLRIYKNQITNYISDKLEPIVSKYGIDREFITKFITEVLSNENLPKIVNNLISNFVNNNERFAQARTYNELLTAFTQDPEANKELSSLISSFAITVLSNPKINSLLIDFIYEWLVTNQLHTNISKAQITNLYNPLKDFVLQDIKNLNVIPNILESLLNNVQYYGVERLNQLFSDSAIEGLMKSFGLKGEIDQEKLWDMLRRFAASNIIQNNKTTLKQLVTNLMNKTSALPIGNLALSILPENIKSVIERFVAPESLASFVDFIFTKNEARDIVKNLAHTLIDNFDVFKNFTDSKDLANKLIKKVDINFVTGKLKPLIHSILNDNNTNEIYRQIILSSITSIGLDAELPIYQKLAFELSSQINPIVKEIGIVDPIIDKLAENLKQVHAQNSPVDHLSELTNGIAQIVQSKLSNNPIDLFVKFIKRPVFANNKEAFANIAISVYERLIDTGTISNFLREKLPSLIDSPSISKYVDRDELLLLVSDAVFDPDFHALIKDIIRPLILNTDWASSINNTNELIVAILRTEGVLDAVVAHGQPLVAKILNNGTFNRSFVKLLKTIASDYGYNFEDQKYDDGLLKLSTSLIKIANEKGIINSAVDIFFNKLQESSDLTASLNEVKNQLGTIINFGDYSLMKSILSSEFFSANKEDAKLLLSALVNQTIAHPKLESWINDGLLNGVASSLNVNVSELNQFVLNLIKDPKTKTVLLKVVEFATDNAADLASANSYQELLLKVVKNADLINLLEANLKPLIKEKLKDPFTTKLIKGITLNTLNNSYSWVFENTTNKEQVVSDLISLIIQSEEEFDIVNRVFSALVTFANDSRANTLDDLVGKVKLAFNDLFDNNQTEATMLKMFKLLNNSFVSRNKNDLIQIVKNIYNHFLDTTEEVEKIYDLLPVSLKEEISKYATKEESVILSQFVLNNASFKDIVFDVVTKTINNFDSIANATSFEEIIKALVNNAAPLEYKQKAKAIVESIFGDNKIKNIIKNVANKVFQSQLFEVYENGASYNLVSSAVDNIIPLAKQLGIYDVLFDTVFNVLEKAKVSSTPSEEFKKLPSLIKEKLLEKFNANPASFIEKIFNSQIVTSNREYLKKILKFYLNKAIKNGSLAQILNNAIVNDNSQIWSYLDKTNAQSLVNQALSNENTNAIIESIINFGFRNNSWIPLINEPKELIATILRGSDLLNLSSEVDKLVKAILTSDNLSATIVKTVNKLLSDNGFNFTVSSSLGNGLVDVVKNIIYLDKSNSLIKKFMVALNARKSEIRNFDALINVSKEIFGQIIDFKDYSIVHAILNSNIWSATNKTELSSIANKLIDKYYINENIEKILEAINFASIAEQLSADGNKLKNVVRELLQSSQVKLLLKKAATRIINNVDIYKNTYSYDELAKAIVSDNDFIALIKPDIKQIFNLLLQKSDVKEIIKNIIKNFLNNSNVRPYLAGVSNIDGLITNLIGLYDILDKHIGISDLAFETIVASIRSNGLSFNASSLVTGLLNGLQNIFVKAGQTESKVVALVKDLATSRLITENKNDLVKIVENIFINSNKEELVEKIFNSLGQDTKDTIAKYLPENETKELLVYILNNANVKNIINKTIKSVLLKADQFANVTSYNDISNKLFEIIDINSIAEDLKKLINDLTTQTQVTSKIYSFLKTTLTTYHVDVTNANVDRLLRDISNNLHTVLNQIDLINPILDKIVQITNEAKANKTNAFSIITKIPSAIKDIFVDKVTKNPRALVDKLLELSFIKNNKAAFIKILQDLFVGLNKEGVIANLITGAIQRIDSSSPILAYTNRVNLANAVRELLAQDSLNNIVKKAIALIIDDTRWIDYINSPNDLINWILSKKDVLRSLKGDIKNLLENFVQNEQVGIIGSDILTKFATDYGIELENVDVPRLGKAIVSEIIPILKQANLWDSLFNTIYDKILASNNLSEFTDGLVPAILGLFDLNNYQIVKSIVNSKLGTEHREVFFEAIKALFAKLGNDAEFTFNLINNFPSLKTLLDKYSITNDQIKNLITTILGSENAKGLLNELFKSVHLNFEAIKNANSYEELLKALFANTNQNNNLALAAKKVILDIANNESFKNVAAKIATTEIIKTPYSRILNNVTNKESLIKNLFEIYTSTENKVQFTQDLMKNLFDKLGQNGTNLNINDLLTPLIEKFKAFASGENWEARAIELLKDLTRTNLYSSNKNDLITFIKNLIDYGFEELNFGQIIWDALGNETREFLSSKILPSSDFISVVNATIRNNNLKEIISNVVKFIINNPEVINQSSSIMEMLQNYLKVSNNEATFKVNLKAFVKDALTNATTKEVVKKMVNKFFTFLEINNNANANTMINSIVEDFGNFAERIGVLDRFANSVAMTLKNNQSVDELIQNIKRDIFEGMDITNYSFFKQIITDPLIQNNKANIKALAGDVINALLSTEEKIGQVLRDLNIGALLGASDTESVNDMLTIALQNRNIREVLVILVEDIVDNANTVYSKKTNWISAFSAFLNSSRSNEVKGKVKNWIKEVFKREDNRFINGIVAIVVKMLRENGIEFNDGDDSDVLRRVLKSTLKEIVSDKYSEFNIIFDNIFNNIKTNNFENEVNIFNALIREVKKGIMSIFLNDAKTNISLKKIMERKKLISGIIEAIGYNDYVKFINLLFERSNKSKTTGMYSILNGVFQFKTTESSNSGSSSGGSNAQPKDPKEPNYGFELGISIFNLVDEVKNFLGILFEPMYKQLMSVAIDRNANPQYFKTLPGYKAMYRLSAVVLWFLKEKAGISDFLFWNATNSTAEGTFNFGLYNAYERAWDSMKMNQYVSYLNSNKRKMQIMGAKSASRGGYDSEFVVGNRSNGTNNSNYWADQLLAYVYYRIKNPIDRHNRSKSKTDVIIDSLEKGYLGALK